MYPKDKRRSRPSQRLSFVNELGLEVLASSQIELRQQIQEALQELAACKCFSRS